MWISKALLLSCFVLIAAEFESDADLSSTVLHRTDRSIFCAAKFRVIENHSACLQRSKNNPGVSEEDQKMIVEMHNGKRSSVQPEATNMLRLSWDDEVAMIAQKWADKCDMKHEEKNTQRDIPGRFSVGQNIAMGAKDWWYAIEMWHDEVKDFKYGSQENSTLPNIGNYTQMVWAETNKIGCGFSVCKDRISMCATMPHRLIYLATSTFPTRAVPVAVSVSKAIAVTVYVIVDLHALMVAPSILPTAPASVSMTSTWSLFAD
ncbi:cysteine-rich venom protein TEL1-like [Pomacea canaliculata]|uniref:cysteine-rich venom protein TEL1-like n=1 Tax=Pomacea canaliculata TaxID=400727 RepID=UPI000D7394C7|nr:cysteine-rich venom protein TEL1-like [Pomacea canaliculata]